MKKGLLTFLFTALTLLLCAQRDSAVVFQHQPQKLYAHEVVPNISIYPVPVKDNSFTVKAERDMNAVKVTNMIGQDIFNTQFKNPLNRTIIFLDNPVRGMYLVTIIFVDGTRIVRKIMVDTPE
ncbi:MAG: T9SS type A sorting domain-containing protein [Bacteroidales bacterium]